MFEAGKHMNERRTNLNLCQLCSPDGVPLGAASSLQPEKPASVQTVPDQSSSQLICQDILIPSFNVVAK